MSQTEEQITKNADDIYNWMRHEKLSLEDAIKTMQKVTKYLKRAEEIKTKEVTTK